MNPFRRCLCAALGALTLFAVGCASAAEPSPPTIPTLPPRQTSATISLMSWNVLNPSWDGGPVENRVSGLLATINKEKPDLIGFQEASQPWHDQFASLPDCYVAVNARTAKDKAAMTTFFYNNEVLTLKENGIIDLDANSDIRIVSWAVFAVNGADVQFLITNTHPDSRQTQCYEHTLQYLEIVRTLQSEKNLPLLCVGDFNATELSDSYNLHIRDGFGDAKYADGVELLNDADSYLKGDYGGLVTQGLGSRDHIFYKGAVKPITFTTLVSNDTLLVSDHLPILGTLLIGE